MLGWSKRGVQDMTLQQYNKRKWLARVDTLRPREPDLTQYLKTKDTAKAYAPVVKARPDQALIDAWYAKRAA